MQTIKFTILFLILNFGGLALGSWLMNNGSTSNWYSQLNKAPWTPPGWVFGAAWTLIMICFSIYLSFVFTEIKQIKPIKLFVVSWILNVSWNYIFFNKHLTVLGLVILVLLTTIICWLLFTYKAGIIKNIRFLLIPYMIWLCIATTLNAYIVLKN